jgi:hypothetical protein
MLYRGEKSASISAWKRSSSSILLLASEYLPHMVAGSAIIFRS